MSAFSIRYDSPEEVFQELFTLRAGYIIKGEGEFTTLLLQIEERVKAHFNGEFKVRAVTVGTPLYALYGAGYLLVVKNTLIKKTEGLEVALPISPDGQQSK